MQLDDTNITLKIIGFAGLDDIILVRHTSPLVQMSSVVEIIDLDLAFFGQFKIQHVHWQVELGLGLVEVLLVQGITGNLG